MVTRVEALVSSFWDGPHLASHVPPCWVSISLWQWQTVG